MPSFPRWRLPLVFAVIAVMLAACERSFDEGEFRGLKIGSTKKQVLEVLVRDNDVRHVSPATPVGILVDRSSIENLDLLYAAEGIGFAGSRVEFPSISVRIFFAADTVVKLDFAPPKLQDDFGLRIGQTRPQVLERLERVIRAEPSFRAQGFVVDFRSISLDEITVEGIAFIMRHDTWLYNTNHEYSTTTLWFSDDTLVKIRHYWSPIELP